MSTPPPATHAPPPETGGPWAPQQAEDTYRLGAWSNGYFEVSERGTLDVLVPGADKRADLHALVSSLRERGVDTPMLLRFQDILEHRLTQIRDAFATAIEDNEYRGAYRPVYPIKVNQQQHVVEEVATFGTRLGFGLEVGSKPELLAVMALSAGNPDQLIVCNGFKDDRYIEAVVLATKLGRRIVPVIENMDELQSIIDASQRFGVRPSIGVRVKLSAGGAGRWKDSVGSRSKFGLFFSELIRVVDTLRRHNMLECLELLHCHAGSQFQDIKQVKHVITELTHVYSELRRLGAPITLLDIGGGLGVDYKGDQSNSDSSMNYTLEEFASDVIYRIGSICDAKAQPHPDLVTECGRAMVAYSSVLVFDVVGSTGPGDVLDRTRELGPAVDHIPHEHDPTVAVPQPIADLRTALNNMSEKTFVECFHDAATAREACQAAFALGYGALEERALADTLYWRVCDRVRAFRDAQDEEYEDLAELDVILSDVYFANFSLFQSLPDTWAINQLFPIMPINRLDEEPSKRVILADITCDSDGKIDRFIDDNKTKPVLEAHPLNGEPYTLAVFLVGAYQETLGDLHNLFGDAHAVHVELDDGDWTINEIVRGDTAREVLGYVQYDPDRFYSVMSRDCENARRQGRLSVQETRALMAFYETGLNSYTYLDPTGLGREPGSER